MLVLFSYYRQADGKLRMQPLLKLQRSSKATKSTRTYLTMENAQERLEPISLGTEKVLYAHLRPRTNFDGD